ncbi:MAG: TlpA family protein disulfide reductase [Candidatus Heimdallarchaeota archaeon]|nr:TlpA family protein disulfide reductase [Candidatus Heimdallarchaeota archaeon]
MKLATISACMLIISIGISQPVSAYGLNITFTNTNNEESNLSIYEDSYLFVDAFASWCDSCRTEMVHLEELYEAVGDQIQMISLSVDPDDTIDKIKNFKNEFTAPWDFGLDHESQFLHTYPLITYPSTYFFDGEGKILQSWTGITSTSKFLNDMKDYIEIPEGYGKNDELDLYVDEIISNSLFLITGSILILILIYNVTKRKQIAVKD